MEGSLFLGPAGPRSPKNFDLRGLKVYQKCHFWAKSAPPPQLPPPEIALGGGGTDRHLWLQKRILPAITIHHKTLQVFYANVEFIV